MGCKDGLLSLRWVRVSFGPHLALVQIHSDILLSFPCSFSLHVSAQRHDSLVNLPPSPAVPDCEFLSNGRGDGAFGSDA
jgi:hypothetical protein